MRNSVLNDAVSFDLQLGTMKFVRGASSAFAVVRVEVTIEDTSNTLDTGTHIEMDIKFPVNIQDETMLGIAEAARSLIIEKLGTAVDIVRSKNAEYLLFGSDAYDPLLSD